MHLETKRASTARGSTLRESARKGLSAWLQDGSCDIQFWKLLYQACSPGCIGSAIPLESPGRFLRWKAFWRLRKGARRSAWKFSPESFCRREARLEETSGLFCAGPCRRHLGSQILHDVRRLHHL